MKRKWFSGIGAGAIALLVLSGCSATTTTPPGAGDSEGDDGQIVIGYSQVTLGAPGYVLMKDNIEEQAEKLGAKVVFLDANGDVAKQNQDLQNLAVQGVDIVLLDPVNPDGVTPGLEALAQADIPVITVDRPLSDETVTFVGLDNEKMGRLVGEQMVKEFPDGAKIIEIQGAAGDLVMMARRDGFHSAFEGENKYEVIQSAYTGYDAEQATKVMQDLLQAHPDVDAVYSHWDGGAIAAINVLSDAGQAGDVKVYGIDGDIRAVKAMLDGTFSATAVNDLACVGRTAARLAVDVAEGGTLPEGKVEVDTKLISADIAADYDGPLDQIFVQYCPAEN